MVFKAQRTRDPLHNLIEFRANEFENVLWRVIQTRPFQRLRRVKQLGFSDFVYPGATHSRLMHSIGVFHTARRLMKVIEGHLGSERFEETHARVALAAALVHDLGHGPFSHAFEDVGKELKLKMANHEVVSDILTLLRSNSLLLRLFLHRPGLRTRGVKLHVGSQKRFVATILLKQGNCTKNCQKSGSRNDCLFWFELC